MSQTICKECGEKMERIAMFMACKKCNRIVHGIGWKVK